MLDIMHKAVAVRGDIFEPHHDPWLREHIETATNRLSMLLGQVEGAIRSRFYTEREMTKGFRLSDLDAAGIEKELAGKRLASFTTDDWMNWVGAIIARYMPEAAIQDEAEFIAIRSYLLGKARLAAKGAGEDKARGVAAKLINAVTFPIRKVPGLKALDFWIMDIARNRAAELISSISEDIRHKMRATILNWQGENLSGGKRMGQQVGTLWTLENKLYQQFGDVGKDMRRIALTEASRNANEGYVASLKIGATVKRVEAYDACPFCKSIDGKILTVVSPDKPDKNWDTEVWVGKTNYGRSGSPMKQEDGGLVPREPEEMWSIAAGPIHPNCRGQWLPVDDRAYDDVAPKFRRFIDDLVKTI